MLRRVSRRLFLLILALTAVPHAFAAATLPRIRVAPDNHGFVTESGQTFHPIGVTYYRPGTGWAPQLWKQFDAEATRADFARLHEMGGNCVRVFLTYGSFCSEPGKLDESAVRKLDQFLDLAEANGLYVHPTGPDHWEGLPDWAKTDRITDEKMLRGLEDFWRLLAGHLRGRTVIFAYDLLNEPEVPWDSPSLRSKWNQWLTVRYRDHASLTNAWKRSDVPVLGEVGAPPKEDAELDPRLLDYQHLREATAVEWTRRQAVAIRAADPQALVTAGFIQWAVPAVLAHVGHYAAFRPEQHAPYLDFMTFHFYPLENGPLLYDRPEAEGRNLAYLECLTREFARLGKPVIIGEFGWHGGGKPKAFKDAPVGTEEDQARWCRQVVERTRGPVCGWLNWGFRDQPEAADVSEFTGLLTAGGKEKAWGREFRRLARDLVQNPDAKSVPPGPRPALEWDRLITSRRVADAFRAEYIKAYLRSP